MIEQLESELRSALRIRAAELPTGAGARVRARDYRPRTRDLRPPVAAGVLTTAAAAAAAVLLIDLGPQAPAAFAGWSSTPTRASAAQVAGAKADCTSQLAGLPHGAGPDSTATLQRLPSLASRHPVLTDTRGPFTFVIYSGADGANAACISSPDFTSLSIRAGTGTSAPPAGKIVTALEAHTAHAGDAYAFVEGHAGAGVTAVTLVLSDGSHVQTTLQNGWLVAWWPGSALLSAAQVTTSAGTATQRLDTRTTPSCTPPPGAPAGRTSGNRTASAPNTSPPATDCAAIGGGQGEAAGSLSMMNTQGSH